MSTIAAIATPAGKGGIGIIRVSGPEVKTVMGKILYKNIKERKLYFGNFYLDNDNIIDQGLAIYFAKPKSFTGEDILELHAHGSPIVLDILLKKILTIPDVRLAKPGEFSERAFLNNKIDLIQAEAIADLIDSTSEQAAKSAIKSLQGEFSQKINKVNKQIINLRTHIESAIDFTEEEIKFLHKNEILNKLITIEKNITNIIEIAEQGNILKEGITIVLTGKPNVGKSTLINKLSKKDIAIVTNIAGTTRDVLKENINIDGVPINIIDTAGLRQSNDIIEKEGLKRAYKEIEKADEILLLIDASDDIEKVITEIKNDFFKKIKSLPKITVVRNKIDLLKEIPSSTQYKNTDVISISAKYNNGLNYLKDHLKKTSGFNNNSQGIFIARRRHLTALEEVKCFILSAIKQCSNKYELIAEDLRQAQLKLNEITGEFTTEDLLEKIFSNFCIGK